MSKININLFANQKPLLPKTLTMLFYFQYGFSGIYWTLDQSTYHDSRFYFKLNLTMFVKRTCHQGISFATLQLSIQDLSDHPLNIWK